MSFSSLDSTRTALVVAYAALSGYGRQVVLPSEYTYVLVTKGRTPTQGGASAERFKRSIRASILQLVRDVRSALDSAGLEYDLVVRKSSGGLESGLFIVYAPLEVVKSVVSPVKSKNARILVKPAFHRVRITSEEKKPIILGVDPGTSIGIAVLDLDGKPLLVTSTRTPDREKLLELVLSAGKPIVVAVDTSKPPEYVKKLSAALNAVLYTPENDLSVEEKQKIVYEYTLSSQVEVPDSHARDALAAAIKAFKSIKPLVEEVESKLRGIAGVDKGEVVVEVLKGKPLSTVLEEVFARELGEKVQEQVLERTDAKESYTCPDTEWLRARVAELEAAVKKLEDELKAKDELIRNLEVELKLATKRSSTEEECERKINVLRLELDYLKKALEEKSRVIEELSGKISFLEKLLLKASMSELLVAAKDPRDSCPDIPIYASDARQLEKYVECARSKKTFILIPRGLRVDWKTLKVPVIEADVVYDLGAHVLVERSVAEEAKTYWKIIAELEAQERKERILKMIREYQEARKKQLQ